MLTDKHSFHYLFKKKKSFFLPNEVRALKRINTVTMRKDLKFTVHISQL